MAEAPSKLYAFTNLCEAKWNDSNAFQAFVHRALTDLKKQTFSCQRPQLSHEPSPELIQAEISVTSNEDRQTNGQTAFQLYIYIDFTRFNPYFGY